MPGYHVVTIVLMRGPQGGSQSLYVQEGKEREKEKWGAHGRGPDLSL